MTKTVKEHDYQKENEELLRQNINMYDALDLKSERIQELKKQLATAIETLKKVHEVKHRLEHTSDFGVGFQPPTNALAFIHLEVERALAEIGGEEV